MNEARSILMMHVRIPTYSKGLQVIYRRGKGLLEFVENYRKLTRISAPMKTEIPLEQFLSDLQRLYPELEVQYKCPSSQAHLVC